MDARKAQPTELNPSELKEAVSRIPRCKQGRRLITYLSKHPQAITVDCNSRCAIGNLSDVAANINPILYSLGLFVGCERPPKPVKNRFNEPSHMFLWSIYRVTNQQSLPLAANDEGGDL